MTDRRTFIATSAMALLAVPLVGEAQQAGKVYRVGLIFTTSPVSEMSDPSFKVFVQGLRDLGWVEGQNFAFEYRDAAGKNEVLPGLAAELVRLKMDVIVTFGTPATRAAKQATTTIPIVTVGIGDPVQTGLVASLGRPGGNITGNTILGPEIAPKRLQLLKEAIPKVSRVAFLWNPTNASNAAVFQETKSGAQALGVTVQSVEVSNPNEFERALAAMMRGRPHALIMTADSMHQLNVGRVVNFAAKNRLPVMYQVKENVIAGGLMSYGATSPDLFRRAAAYVDKILKGAKPGDLPVEQPTKFELVINLKTAKALGLRIPPSLLGRADEVIQ